MLYNKGNKKFLYKEIKMIKQNFEDFWTECIIYGFERIYTKEKYEEAFAKKEVNGCGAKGGIDVPDNILGMPITTLCNIHDTEWYYAKNFFELVESNQRLRRNIEKKIDKYSANSFMVWIRMKILHHYYDAVKLIGTPAYAKEKGFEKV